MGAEPCEFSEGGRNVSRKSRPAVVCAFAGRPCENSVLASKRSNGFPTSTFFLFVIEFSITTF